MKIVGLPYKITLKSLTDHTSLWLTDFPYYDQKNRKLMVLPQAVFFVWQFMVHRMICISGQPGNIDESSMLIKCSWLG